MLLRGVPATAAAAAAAAAHPIPPLPSPPLPPARYDAEENAATVDSIVEWLAAQVFGI